MPEPLEIVNEGFALTKEQRRLLIRVFWVLLVTVQMLYVHGFLAYLGLAAPFARAADVEDLKRAAMVNARIQIIQEMRVQKTAFCRTTDEQTRDSIIRYLVRLQGELKDITNEVEPVQPNCDRPLANVPPSQ